MKHLFPSERSGPGVKILWADAKIILAGKNIIWAGTRIILAGTKFFFSDRYKNLFGRWEN